MAGIKYVLTNNTTAIQFFDYKTLSDAMWNYQVSLNPGQTKTIWAELDSLKIYNNGAITIEEQSSFPPVHSDLTGGGIVKQYIDYTNKSILVFSELPESTNLGYSILDFDNNVTYGPIDLGYSTDNVAGGYWYIDNIFPFTNSGYAIYLTNDDNDNKASIYLDYRGTVIGEYSASTNSRNYDMLNGKFAYFIDYDNEIFNYSDGKTFKSREFNGVDYMFGVVGGYWDDNNNNSFVTALSNGSYNSYTLITMDSEIPLVNWDGDNTQIGVFQYSNSNFTTTMNYNTNDGTYKFFNIYSSTGTILQSIDLTLGDTYDDFDLSFFGTNKMNIIFYYDGDVNTPYLIYTYDGETNTLISTTHQRTTNFSDWQQRYDSLYGADTNFPSQDFHIFFFNESDNNYDFITSLYFNVLSYFSGDTEYRTPYILNYSGGTVNWVDIYDEFLGSSLMLLYYEDGGNILKLLTITSDGVSSVDVTPLGPLDGYNIFTWWVGDTFLFMTFTDYTSAGTLYAYDAMGNLLDYVLFYNGWNGNYSYGTFYFETDPGAYYFNTANSKFTSIDYYDDVYRVTSYYTNTFKKPSNMVLSNFGMDGYYSRLLTENNLSPEVVLPYPNCCYLDLLVGKDVILYVYINNNENLVISLYNLSFSLLQSLTITQYNNIYNTMMAENRALVQIENNGIITNYMVSANGIKTVESTNNYDWRLPNDNYWC